MHKATGTPVAIKVIDFEGIKQQMLIVVDGDSLRSSPRQNRATILRIFDLRYLSYPN